MTAPAQPTLPKKLATNGHYLTLPGARDTLGCIDGDCGDDTPLGEPPRPWVAQERLAAEIAKRYNAHAGLVAFVERAAEMPDSPSAWATLRAQATSLLAAVRGQ